MNLLKAFLKFFTKNPPIDLKKLQLDFLEETINHYNSENRSLDMEYGLNCTYSADRKGTEGCAIGRKLTPELALLLDRIGGSVNNPAVFRLLPAELKVLGKDFLFRIQGLHDHESLWDLKGINEKGMIRVNSIKEFYQL